MKEEKRYKGGDIILKKLNFLFSRIFIITILIVIQIVFLILAVLKLTEMFFYLYGVLTLISLLVVIYIVSTKNNPSYKLAWTIPVLALPVFGGLFYLIFGRQKTTKKFIKQMMCIHDKTNNFLIQDEEILKEIQLEDKSIYRQVKYLENNGYSPVYKNTITSYLSPGEEYYKVLLKELKKAKKYIFMEYFIIEEGKMWNSILDVLIEKVREGVDVRLIYDDMGCLRTLPYKYNETLKALGIKVVAFNPFVPFLTLFMNNRDHRKITVIDGHTAFTGGINIADEYINEVERFGHWKDSGLMLKGDAVWKFTVMFLQTWIFSTKEEVDLKNYYPHINYSGDFEGYGYVQPYGDSPLDDEIVGENVYLNIINNSKNYVYITSPYLIVDNEIVTALTLAAKSGIDVKIITPHIPDKWYIHMVTRAYYEQLVEAGVEIYEYEPGFIHSKSFVCDDEIGVVGTINLDYRSLYLHFECGVLMYKTEAIKDIKEDFLETLKISKRISIEDTKKIKWANKFITAILRVFAPLM